MDDNGEPYPRQLDRIALRPDFRGMEILTVAQAKPRMGRLIDRALKGKSVVIRKGKKMVQLTEFVVPEPIPERPVGFFRRRPADYATANRTAANAAPVR
jgi:hypothetical protein